jgi:hypothetical protein
MLVVVTTGKGAALPEEVSETKRSTGINHRTKECMPFCALAFVSRQQQS